MTQSFLPWLGLLVQAFVAVAFVLVVRRRKDATARRRALRIAGWTAALVWMIGGMCWSDLGLQYRWLAAALLPQALTTWPAHEAALALSGMGIGANARTAIPITALCAAVWAIVLWSPLLTLRSRIVAVRAAVIIQGLALIVVALTFYAYGNG